MKTAHFKHVKSTDLVWTYNILHIEIPYLFQYFALTSRYIAHIV